MYVTIVVFLYVKVVRIILLILIIKFNKKNFPVYILSYILKYYVFKSFL
jgi:hypothetical protein